MKVKIAKWGNSLAVRLPKRLADDLGLRPGSTVELNQHGSKLAMETARPERITHYRLEDLLDQIKPGAVPPPLQDWSALEPPWPEDDWSDIAPSDEEMGIPRTAERRTSKHATSGRKRR